MTADARRVSDRALSWMVLVAILLLGGAVLARELDRGWVPHDEGALGQSAERVMHGELPHRDFDEIYTGLQSYLDAAAFRMGGVSVRTLRIPLFMFALVWLSALFSIARRFAPPLGAGLIALTCFLYSVPNYRAAMPSWYILFFATFGLLALVRWHETGGQRRWLVAAGAAGGIAILFKLSGIFYTGGGALAILAATAARRGHDSTPSPLRIPVALTLAGATVLLALTVGHVGGAALFRFVVPFGCIAFAIAATERQASNTQRVRTLVTSLGPYVIGVALPIACFAMPYVIGGGVSDLVYGTLVVPFRRLASASMVPPAPIALLWSLPIVWLAWPRRPRSFGRIDMAVAIAWSAVLVVASGDSARYYQAAWYAAWSLPFLLAFTQVAYAMSPRLRQGAGAMHAMATTISIIAVCCVLIEFPFAAPLYTLYALPLSILAVACVVRARGQTPVAAQLIGAAFFCAFAYVRIVPGTIYSIGAVFRPPQETEQLPPQEPEQPWWQETAELTLPRATLRVEPDGAALYNALIPFVQAQAKGGVIWAGPDAPEIYFLTGLQNHTRTTFDFLDRSAAAALPLPARVARIGASVVVLKQNPQFSVPPTPADLDALALAYPHQKAFDGFLVRWR